MGQFRVQTTVHHRAHPQERRRSLILPQDLSFRSFWLLLKTLPDFEYERSRTIRGWLRIATIRVGNPAIVCNRTREPGISGSNRHLQFSP